MSSPKVDSIERSLQQKEEQARSQASLELEKEFRHKYAKQNVVVAKNFDVPSSEFVIDHYACSHYGKIPKQGRLYITPRFVLFYANILGKKVKKKIPYEKVMEIKKDASSMLSPIEIQLKFKRFTFVSFSHKEKAYSNLMLQWKSNKEGKPFEVKIPLNEDAEEGEGEDESENASLSNNQAAEPSSGAGMVELQSMWGSAQATAIVGEEKPSKGGFRAGTLSKMPKLYSGGEDKERVCSCFPCFK